jgi:tight adherence protein C
VTSPLFMLPLVGAVGGLGVVALVSAYTPAAPLRLDDALDRLDERKGGARLPVSTTSRHGWRARLDTQWLALALALPGAVPSADLQVIGWTRERFLVSRLTTAVQFAALFGPVLAVLSTVLGLGLPTLVPVVGTVVGGALGFRSAGTAVTSRAGKAREEMRHATVSYLRQVALLGQSGAGVVSALTRPTTLATSSWAFGRLRAQLELSRRSGEQPWTGLKRFGEEIDVEELSDLAEVAAAAGSDGAAVVSTLIERADSLTTQIQTEQRTEQNKASGKMNVPSTALVGLLVVYVGYPLISQLLLS